MLNLQALVIWPHISRRILSLGFLLCICSTTSFGSHLVGGEMTYRCLGNNTYEISLRVYRDCQNGVAPFDSIADINIFDVNNNLVTTLNVVKSPTIGLSVDSTGNPCVSAPPGLCTEYTWYVDTVSLPPINGGYTLVYARCCRNSTIQNIPNPSGTGNAYTTTIPSMDVACNSSPRFVGSAPIVLCLNKAVSLPINVSEVDGDSLHFEFCDILDNTPSTPPFGVVQFIPPYSSSDPLPGVAPFTIDPITGVLSGTPNQLGQYVVGICVSEFRNGQQMSMVRLDYQFNITNCVKSVVSDMVTPTEDPSILCDGLNIQFTSESINAQNLLWDFGDPSTTSDTARGPNPTYNFPAAGVYNVTLIANPRDPCSDTIVVPFNVSEKVVPDFLWDGVTCFLSQDVRFTVIGGYPANTSFSWDFGPDANYPIVTQKNPPSIMWSTPGKHYVTLTITYGANCVETKLDSVEISNISSIVDAGPNQTIKEGEVVYLQAIGGVDYFWYASDPVEISSRITAATSAKLTETDTITFYVRVTDAFGCVDIDSVKVFVLDADPPIVYNFFSPDGDGKNEEFDLGVINPDRDCSITIFNRWGSVVWSRASYANDWTGLDEGNNPLPDGTYYYILSCDGKVDYKAAITLMRNP